MRVDSRGPRIGQVGGLLAVVATYAIFLLWDQFGFLRLLHRQLDDPDQVQWIMGAMGLAGLAASLSTAYALAKRDPRQGVVLGLVVSAVVAGVSVQLQSFATLILGGIGIGVATGILTVALASGLRSLVGPRHVGLKVGTATGLGYTLCNVPWLFEARPETQAWFVAGLALLAAATLSWQRTIELPSSELALGGALQPRDDRGLGFLGILLGFLALVWLDSAAFAIIQESASLKALTWGGEGQKMQLGGVHLIAGMLAGYLVDRGRFGSLLLTAFALFAVALPSIDGGRGGIVAWFYAVGISLYSVALVLYPSYGAERPDVLPRRWRAGLIFGLAGWLGSALGVGMAQDLHRIPHAFIVFSGLVVVLSVMTSGGLGRHRQLLLGRLGWVRSHWIVGYFALTALTMVLAGVFPPDDTGSSLAAGRGVYVGEGCINCHSQYIRPESSDEELWGPYRPVERGGEVVLVGNRRQGPDLLNVGARRSRAWQRIHLENPRDLVPESRMPSYAYLFRDGDPRGPLLVDYLASLGVSEKEEPWFPSDAYNPGESLLSAGESEGGEELFLGLCSVCHGIGGAGDTELARQFSRPAMNLRKGSFWGVSWGGEADPLELGLARLIKFGARGTEMPGHEWLSDPEIADLVAYVMELSTSGLTTGPRELSSHQGGSSR